MGAGDPDFEIRMEGPEISMFSDMTVERLKRCEQKVMGAAVSMLQNEIRGEARAKKVVNTGALINSIQRSVEFGDGVVTGKIFTPLKYAPVMEYGRDMGKKMPPDDRTMSPHDQAARPIAWWIIRKGIARPNELRSREDQGILRAFGANPGRRTLRRGEGWKVRRGALKGTRRMTTPYFEGIVFLIRRAIARDGIDGRRFLRDAVRRVSPIVLAMWREGIMQCLTER